MKAHEFVCSVSLLLMIFCMSISSAIPIDPDDCELHAPISMHEFCCEIHDENTEFVECQVDWNDKIHSTNEELELQQSFCISECVYNKTNYLGKDRQSLRMNFIRHHLSELHGDEKSEELLYKTFEKCGKHAKEMLDHDSVKKIANEIAPHNCHPYPGLVFECVSNHLILQCPEKKFYKTAQCEHAREYLKACLKTIK